MIYLNSGNEPFFQTKSLKYPMTFFTYQASQPSTIKFEKIYFQDILLFNCMPQSWLLFPLWYRLETLSVNMTSLSAQRTLTLYRSQVPIISTEKCWSLDNRACFFRKDTVVLLNTVFTAGVRTMFSLLSIFLQTWHPFKRNSLNITYHTVTWLCTIKTANKSKRLNVNSLQTIVSFLSSNC